jgi:hypothetical protein
MDDWIPLIFIYGQKYHNVLIPGGQYDRFGNEVMGGCFIKDGDPIPANGRIVNSFVYKKESVDRAKSLSG